jgi:hypothetical protein
MRIPSRPNAPGQDIRQRTGRAIFADPDDSLEFPQVHRHLRQEMGVPRRDGDDQNSKTEFVQSRRNGARGQPAFSVRNLDRIWVMRQVVHA